MPREMAGTAVESPVAGAERVEFPSMSGEVCRRYIVSGRVQGVFFRASTASVAHRLGLRGRARNLPNGNVMVLALGPESKVDELAEWLRDGPPSAQVTEVQQADEPLDQWQHLPDFRTH